MRPPLAMAGVPSEEVIQLFCAACMVVPFAVVLLCVLGMLVSDRRNRDNGRRTGPKPPRTLPPPST